MIADQLKHLRAALKLSQADLARSARVSQQAIARLEVSEDVLVLNTPTLGEVKGALLYRILANICRRAGIPLDAEKVSLLAHKLDCGYLPAAAAVLARDGWDVGSLLREWSDLSASWFTEREYAELERLAMGGALELKSTPDCAEDPSMWRWNLRELRS